MQGKSLPSAARGELLRVDFPKGTGEVIAMWDRARVASPRTASKVDLENMLMGLQRVVVPAEVVSV